MITREQAMALSHGHEIHEDGCKRIIGPRGGITETISRWRVSGLPQPRPRAGDWYVPIKHGLRTYGAISAWSGPMMHLADDCPIRQASDAEVLDEIAR